jgi:hypothetical protein
MSCLILCVQLMYFLIWMCIACTHLLFRQRIKICITKKLYIQSLHMYMYKWNQIIIYVLNLYIFDFSKGSMELRSKICFAIRWGFWESLAASKTMEPWTRACDGTKVIWVATISKRVQITHNWGSEAYENT